jgi:tetratricopeptide (TPR) repeat protein
MNELDHALLDDHFNGLLSPEQRAALMQRLATEPALAEAFRLREELAAFPAAELRRQALKATLGRAGAEFFQEKPAALRARLNTRRWLAAAAALALLAVALWFMGQNQPPSYRQYAQHQPLALTQRGSAQQAATTAEQAFNRGDYAAALPALEQVLAETPDNLSARLYRAICLIETGVTEVARRELDPIAEGNSALRNEAIWYIGLSHLRDQDPAACRRALEKIPPGDARYDAAQRIIRGKW